MRLARDVARQQGEFLDFDSSENQNLDFMLSPQDFIRPNDGSGVRSGKELLLSVRPEVMRRYRIEVVVLIGVPMATLSLRDTRRTRYGGADQPRSSTPPPAGERAVPASSAPRVANARDPGRAWSTESPSERA